MKKYLLVIAILFFQVSGYCFDKLPSQYQVTYGSKEAPIHITEYFSFNCLKCIKFMHNEFATIQKKYIDTQSVYWSFHPDPADMLTLQALICLDHLTDTQKKVFFEVIISQIDKARDQGERILNRTLNSLGVDSLPLEDDTYIEKSQAFEAVYQYLKQSDIVDAVPTIEVNNRVYANFPTLKFIEKKIQEQLSSTQGKQ